MTAALKANSIINASSPRKVGLRGGQGPHKNGEMGEGRVRAMRAARSLGERTVTELILQHQNPQQLSANLWAAVRARGCQFLGPGKIDHYLAFLISCQD